MSPYLVLHAKNDMLSAKTIAKYWLMLPFHKRVIIAKKIGVTYSITDKEFNHKVFLFVKRNNKLFKFSNLVEVSYKAN